ncbi:UNC-like C-terminal-domain-containing protein [Lineolata rhizophorae]|uniref:UNC-like C-terminal-domain-containing protein n=1 Tax=Lineolata rhizophorae TaxID=578093 RepID=A0A6A6P086_9PEZI|nr:UNC-like C-terminal-domain-containing protein [Lineolata rhizophorae]
MRVFNQCASGWLSLVQLLALTSGLEGAAPSSEAAATVTASAADNTTALPPLLYSTSTCPFRTVNYITHTLPQQCLRTSWTAPASEDPQEPHTVDGGNPTSTDDGIPPTTGSSATEPLDTAFETLNATASDSSATINVGDSTRAGSSTTGGESESEGAKPSSESEADSPLDNVKFLSFEEWKQQNLERVGQSPDNVGQGRPKSEGRRRPVAINNALDSLGEDAEIELDFGGFGSVEDSPPSWSSDAGSRTGGQAQANEPGGAEASPSPEHHARSKDAGKTCKERFNYASFDCAATVLKTNPQCKSSSSILVENKDSYMLNECSAENKFLIVELCDDILVDTVVLANFEFFSSMFRTFRVSVSDRYPVKLDRWKELGVFEARNTREIQAFLVENPLIWARYLRIEFLSHYGNEFYCPVSLLRVHGTTMMEEFRHQEELARGEDLDEAIEESEADVVEAVPREKPMTNPEQKPEADISAQRADDAHTGWSAEPQSSDAPPSSVVPSAGDSASNSSSIHANTEEPVNATASSEASVRGNKNESGTVVEIGHLGVNSSSSTPAASEQSVQSTQSVNSTHNAEFQPQPAVNGKISDGDSTGNATTSTASPNHAASVNSTLSAGTTHNATTMEQGSSGFSPSSTNKTTATSATQPPSANPTTQESFFKSIHKRLQMLEANSTLSLQYIEEQSRILRDAFMKVEKRQMAKTDDFISQLNTTVLAELKGFRQQYDQLWQSTVIELQTHREQYQREILELSARLTILADEMVFQKRMAVVQSMLILLCLGLVLFVRSGTGTVEMPLVQQMMHKSQSALRLSYDSPPDSPASRDTGRAGVGRRMLRHFGTVGEEILSEDDSGNDGGRGPELEFSPPTPTSLDGEHSDEDTGGHSSQDRDNSPGPAPKGSLRKVRSTPATPQIVREKRPSWSEGISSAEDGDGNFRGSSNGRVDGRLGDVAGVKAERPKESHEDEDGNFSLPPAGAVAQFRASDSDASLPSLDGVPDVDSG